jgi:hypothetical protein
MRSPQEAAAQQEEIKKQGLQGYRIRVEEYAELSARGESIEEWDLLSLRRLERFLGEDLSLDKEIQQIQKEVRSKYPKWNGQFLTHQSSGGHVGGGAPG